MGVKEFITFDESKNQYIIPVVKLGGQKRWSAVIIKQKAHRKLAARTLAVHKLETLVFDQLGSAAFQIRNIRCLIDNTTDGLWVETPEDEDESTTLIKSSEAPTEL
ncbi:unnamed protein product [Psylliodes chrysocephalus]|uniref:Uncharacterized protein n=1 Tax=Psylliodes chrysocephalus TaxID=3402493 RepID=A0A9P0DAA9_9CUCU|nr:unnamed protein product [Psylliodes chrysocephala]